MSNLQKIWRAGLAFLLTLVAVTTMAFTQTFIPPTEITVRMFRLDPRTGKVHQPPEFCSSGNTNYGCTELVGDPNHAYPYTINPVTVPLETDYLLDVVPKESPPAWLHATAVTAQAIAARTFTYWYAQQGQVINNSTRFQIFVPYKFESLPPITFPDNPADPCASSNLNHYQQIVCDAVALQHYISYNNDSPAFIQFFSDRELETVTNPNHPYLLGVQDPISQPPPEGDASDAGHGQGMSQRGASRWARGNTYANINKPGNLWSVRWDDVRQILTHYYTGVHIRDANGTPLTPPDRWNALRITPTAPLTLTTGLSYPFTLTVQNSGVTPWTMGGGFALGYRWRRAGGQEGREEEGAEAIPIPHDLSPGEAITLTVPVRPPAGATGTCLLMWDMLHGSQWFSRQSPSWPTQEMSVWVIPILTDVYDDPDPFSPDDDGWQEETFLHYTLNQTATVQGVIHTIDECYLNRTLWSGQQPPGEQFVAWDGCLPRNPHPPHPCPTRLLSDCPAGWGVPRDGTYPYHLRAGPQLVTGTVTIDTTLPPGSPLYAAGVPGDPQAPDRLLRSDDGGLTWTEISSQTLGTVTRLVGRRGMPYLYAIGGGNG